MKRNSRLSLALHTLGHMAADPERSQTSAEIAEHAGTNPVVVRRVLGRLREAELLTSEKGHSGGWKLARRPEKITLADVYMALDEQLIAVSDHEQTSKCSIENALQKRVAQVFVQAEKTLLDQLAKTTILEFV